MFIVHYYFLHKERDFSVHCAFSKMHKFFLHLVFGCVTLVSEKKLNKFFLANGETGNSGSAHGGACENRRGQAI